MSTPNADLDRQARAEVMRTILIAMIAVVGAFVIYFGGRGLTLAQAQADGAAVQKFTLAQQVTSACALRSQADALGGLCQKAAQVVKAGPAGAAGVAGVAGSAGVAGADGPLGPKGDPGLSIRGPRGFLGVTGAVGAVSMVPGPTGKAGADSTVAGPSGATGAASTTPGPKGDAGPTGAPGADGKPGVAGQTPTTMTCTPDPAPALTSSCAVTAWR